METESWFLLMACAIPIVTIMLHALARLYQDTHQVSELKYRAAKLKSDYLEDEDNRMSRR